MSNNAFKKKNISSVVVAGNVAAGDSEVASGFVFASVGGGVPAKYNVRDYSKLT